MHIKPRLDNFPIEYSIGYQNMFDIIEATVDFLAAKTKHFTFSIIKSKGIVGGTVESDSGFHTICLALTLKTMTGFMLSPYLKYFESNDVISISDFFEMLDHCWLPTVSHPSTVSTPIVDVHMVWIETQRVVETDYAYFGYTSHCAPRTSFSSIE
jgi:hypothetical protein